MAENTQPKNGKKPSTRHRRKDAQYRSNNKVPVQQSKYLWHSTKYEVLKFIKESEIHISELQKLGAAEITPHKQGLVIAISKPQPKPQNWEKTCRKKLTNLDEKYSTHEMQLHPKPPGNLIEPFVGKSDDLTTVWNQEKMTLVITGVKQSVEQKVEGVQELLQKNMHFSNLLIEKSYQCFINGRKGEMKRQLEEIYTVKLLIPKVHGNDDSMIKISGYDKKSLDDAVDEIVNVYNKMKVSCTIKEMSSVINLTSKQIETFFDKCGVHLTKNEHTYKLLGMPELMDSAEKQLLELLKQNEVIESILFADEWVINIIRKKSKIPSMKAEVEYDLAHGKINLKGTRTEVSRLSQSIQARIDHEKTNKIQTVVNMDSTCYQNLFVYGKKADTDEQCKDCEVEVVKCKENGSMVVQLTGGKDQVEKAKKYLNLAVEKMKTKTVKCVCIEPDLLKYLTGDLYSNMLQIRATFPEVVIAFMDQSSFSGKNLSLTGTVEMVDECHKFIIKTLTYMKDKEEITKKFYAPNWIVKRISKNNQHLDKDVHFHVNDGKIVIKGLRTKVEDLSGCITKMIDHEKSTNMQFVLEISSKHYNSIFRGNTHKTNPITQGCEVEAVPIDKQKSKYKLAITGPNEKAIMAKEHLEKEIIKLERMTTVTVPVENEVTKLLSGPAKATLSGIKRKYSLLKVSLIKSGNIIIEGDCDLVEDCKRHVINVIQQVREDNEEITKTMTAPKWIVQRISKSMNDMYNVVTFEVDSGEIIIKGPRKQVEDLSECITKMIDHEKSTNMQFVLEISSKHYNSIFRGNSQKTNLETQGCEVEAVARAEQSSKKFDVTITGPKERVVRVKQYLEAKIVELERVVTTTVYIEKNVAKFLSGKSNFYMDRIKSRHSLMKVFLNKKENIIIEGDRDLVEDCKRHVNNIVQQCKEDNIPTVILDTFKEYHGFIIGKKGETIKQINMETKTRTLIPTASSPDTFIKIFGEANNCQKAAQKIKDIERKLGNITEKSVDINDAFKLIFHEVESRLRASVRKWFSVIIDGVKNDGELVLRGTSTNITKSIGFLKRLSQDDVKVSNITCKNALQEHLFGYRDHFLYQIKHETKCDVLIPMNDDLAPDTIFVIGPSQNVDEAEASFGKALAVLTDISETKIDMQQKHFNYYQSEGQRQMMELLKHYSTVLINYADSLNTFKVLKLCGPKTEIEAAEKAIKENIDTLDNETRIDFVFPRYSMSDFRHNVTENIAQTHSVRIKRVIIPNQKPKLLIYGEVENCKAAKKQLQSLIKRRIAKKIEIPSNLHGRIIGQKGAGIKEIQKQCQVQFDFPERGSGSNTIRIRGEEDEVDKAIEVLRFKGYGVYLPYNDDDGSVCSDRTSNSEWTFSDRESVDDVVEEKNEDFTNYNPVPPPENNVAGFQRISSAVFESETHHASKPLTSSHSFPNATFAAEAQMQDEVTLPPSAPERQVMKQTFNIKRYGAIDVLNENKNYYELVSKYHECSISFAEFIQGDSSAGSLRLPSQSQIKTSAACCDITNMSYDCIVRSSGSDFSFNGQVSSRILKKGGNSIQTECDLKRLCGESVVITTAGTLPCKNIIHVAIQHQDEFDDIMMNILDVVKTNGLQTLAMPIIGTGGMSRDPDLVLNGLKRGLEKWQRNHNYDLKLTFVVYNDDSLINKVQALFGIKNIVEQKKLARSNSLFQSLRNLIGWQTHARPITADSCHFNDDDANNNPDVAESKCVRGASITIQGYSIEDISKVKEFIFEEVDKKMHVETIRENALQLLSEKDVRTLEDVTRQFNVYLKFCRGDSGSLELQIDGARHNTLEANHTIISFIKDLKHQTDIYPAGWVKTTLENFRIELQKSSSEYKNAEKLFLSTSRSKTFRVQKIEMVQNIMLWKQYEWKKEDLKRKGFSGLLEHQLFHGTSKDAIEQICSRGFDKGFCGKNGTVFGQGVYFANNSWYSDSYTSSTSIINQTSSKHMFLSHVLIGKHCKGNSSMNAPPFLPGSSIDRYDCVVDDVSNPSIFVVFRDADSYPAFLITYT